MIQYSIIGYDSVQYDELWLSRAWQVMTQHIMIGFDKIEYVKLWLSTVLFFMTQYSMTGCDMVQYDRLWLSTVRQVHDSVHYSGLYHSFEEIWRQSQPGSL